MDCGTWKNSELVTLGEGGSTKYEFGGVGDRKDMKHVKLQTLHLLQRQAIGKVRVAIF